MREQCFGCAVPGCTNRVWLEDHHEDLVSEGGTNDPKRRVALCWAHHDTRHRGTLLIEGNADDGWRFFHADGTPYGHAPDPNNADNFRIAHAIMRNMGYKDREAKPAIVTARAHVGGQPKVEDIVAAALRSMPGASGTRRCPPAQDQAGAVQESFAAYVRLRAVPVAA